MFFVNEVLKMMTLEEAIDHAEEVAKIECGKCAEEHRQLAEWLRELKKLREQSKKGKWIRDGHHIRCDQCGMYMCDTDREGDRIPTEFCPNCGADMIEVTI